MTEYLYGRHAVEAVLKNKHRVIHQLFLQDGSRDTESILALAQQRKCRLVTLAREEISRRVNDEAHQGFVLEVEPYAYADPTQLDDEKNTGPYFVCDSVTDPQNLGSLIRSAYCLGVAGLIIPKDRSVGITPVVVKASAGATEAMPVYRVTNLVRTLEALKKIGFWCYGTEARAKNFLRGFSFAEKSVVVFGSEGKGLRRLVAEHCDDFFSIPLRRDFDSLNVAQSATIIAYEISLREKHV